MDKGRAGRRRNIAGVELRGGELTGENQSGAPGVRSGCGLAMGEVRDARNTTGHQTGPGEVCGGAYYDDGGPARRCSSARGVQAVPVRDPRCKRLVELAQGTG